MRNKAIEPTEIIIEGKSSSPKGTSEPNSKIRFLARFLDYSLLLLLIIFVRWCLQGYFPFKAFEFLIPLEFVAWIPIEAFLIHKFGTTPGKWFMGVHISQGRRDLLDWETSIKRSFNVWFRGLGMGIPIFSFFCMLFAYNRLKILRKTSWDLQANLEVFHSSIQPWRVWVASVIIAVGFLWYYMDKYTI